MPSQYPIYLNLEDCNDSSRNRGFGVREDCKIIVNVGSSAKNSEVLAEIGIDSWEASSNSNEPDKRDLKVFNLCVNGVDICQMRFNPKTKEFSNIVDLINKE